MGTFTNSEEQDEMPHNTAFHLSLHCFVIKGKKDLPTKKYNIFLNLYPDTPRYIHWTISRLLYQTSRKNTLVYKGLMIRFIIAVDTFGDAECTNYKYEFSSPVG